jgi:3-methylcrotonyl-CoA carboxylase alpha subunit
MPGKVIQLLVKAGDKVKRGTPLAILEAMKMENTLSAQADATIAEIAVSVGDQVGEGAPILSFETETKK